MNSSSMSMKPGRGLRTGVPGERVKPRRDRVDGDAVGGEGAGEADDVALLTCSITYPDLLLIQIAFKHDQ